MTRLVWVYIFLGIFLFFLSMEFLPMIEIHYHMPDLLLIFVVFIAQRYGPFSGIFCGFFSGLLVDFFSGQLLGAQAFAKMTVGFVAGLIGTRLIVYSFQTVFLVTVFSVCLQGVVFYLEILIFSHLSSLEYFKGIWIDILYTAFISPLFLMILGIIDSKLTKRV